MVDGMVEITERVHVQVPTYAGHHCVVLEEPGDDPSYEFYPERAKVAHLAEDLREALAKAAPVPEPRGSRP